MLYRPSNSLSLVVLEILIPSIEQVLEPQNKKTVYLIIRFCCFVARFHCGWDISKFITAGRGMESDSYYGILGVHVNSSDDEIRRAYRKLAMQWHPDKWTRNPSLLGEAKRKFQQIQEAYSVLSDHRKRAMYDAGFYDTYEDEDEDFSDFLMEMVSVVNQVKREVKLFRTPVKRENKVYSMEELQSMFIEMAKGFNYPNGSYSPQYQWSSSYESSQWGYEPSMFTNSGSSKSSRCETNPMTGANSHVHVSKFRFC